MLLFLSIPARAREIVYTPDDTGRAAATESWEDFVEALPEDAAEAAEGIDPFDPVGSAEAAEQKPGWLVSRVREALESALTTVIPETAPLFASLLVAAAVKTAVPSPVLAESFSRILRLWGACVVFRLTVRAVTLAEEVTGTAAHLMELMVPVTEGICILNGSVTERQVASAGMMLAVTLTGEISAHLLVPLTGALAGLTAVGGLGSFTAGFRKALLRLWQFVTVCVSFLLGAQSVIAKSADSMAQRTAKFALSTFIPVAGGALADAWSAIRTGAGFLRGAAGIGGILALMGLLIPAVVPLVLTKLVLTLASQAAQLLGLGEIGAMLDGAARILELLVAFVLYSAVMFFFALVLFTGIR
ncbi:MAG: hypothetical protein II889_12655 [Clostridia bacterium]|nr:hypothetical protein [Clostridia bacterium]